MKNSRERKVHDGKVFTIYLGRHELEHYKRIARTMSRQEDRDISTCEAIRMALETMYPMNQQLSMFSKPAPKRRIIHQEQLTFA